MARVLIVAGLAAVVFEVLSIVDCALVERARVRGLPRWLWLVLIVVLPVVGGLLWFLIGRGGLAVAPVTRTTGPDDDPEFLRGAAARTGAGPRIPGATRPASSAEEPDWVQLEQELANLDSDADDDGEGRRR